MTGHVLAGDLVYKPIIKYACDGANDNFKRCWLKLPHAKTHRSVRVCTKMFHYGIQVPLMVLATAVAVLAVPLIAFIDLCLWLKNRTSRGFVPARETGCRNFFKSDVSLQYFKNQKQTAEKMLGASSELEKAVQTPANDHLLSKDEREAVECIRFLVNLEATANKRERRHVHQQQTRLLRAEAQKILRKMKTTPLLEQAFGVIKEVIYARYAAMDLSETIHEFAQRFGEHSFKASQQPFNLQISHLYHHIHRTGGLSEKESKHTFFDSHYFGNMPYILDEIPCGETGKKAMMIRMPSVTRDTSRFHFGDISQAKVIEDFMVYHQVLQEKGESHLYINVMNRARTNERHRSAAIESLDRLENSAIPVVSLDKESKFYFQCGPFGARSVETAVFKQQFTARLFHQPKWFYWTQRVDRKNFEAYSKVAMDEIHAKYYGNRRHLLNAERRDFIELHYCYLIRYLLDKIQPERVNMTCLHCIDRGASQQALYKIFTHAQNNEHQESLTDTSVEHLKKLIFLPAILTMNRLIQRPRFDRMASAAGRLLPGSS